MAQFDGQSSTLKDVSTTVVSSLPLTVAVKPIHVLSSVVKFAAGTSELNDQGNLSNEDLLVFYGSQVNE